MFLSGRPRPSVVVSLTVLCGALLVGCDGASTVDPAPASDPAAGSSRRADVPEPSMITPVEATPFSDVLPVVGELMQLQTEDESVQRARHDETQRLIARCMTRAGFEYEPAPWEPADPPVPPWARDGLQLPFLPDDPDLVATYGYGVDDVETREKERLRAEQGDVNLDAVEAMSDAAQVEYYAALTGARGPDDDVAPDGGCAGLADAQVGQPDYPGQETFETYGALIRDMGAVRGRDLPADDRVVALDTEWNACMEDAGWDLWPPAEADILDPAVPGPVSAFYLAVRTPPGGTASWPADDATIDDIPQDRRYLVGSPEEVAIAVADLDCRAGTDYEQRLREVLVDLESRFVQRHATELDELRAALETGAHG